MQKVLFRFTCVAQKCQCSSSLVTVAFVSGCPTKASKKRPPTTGTQFKVCLELKPAVLVKNLETCVHFPFPDVDLGITVVSML